MRLVVLVAIGVALLLPTRAHAHGALKSATPAAGAHLAAAPTSIHLLFSETPSLSMTSIRLVGPNGNDVSLGALAIAADSRSAVMAAIAGTLTSGVYTVRWQMAGDDGHPTRGSYRFTLALAPAMPATSMQTAPMQTDQMHTNPVSQPDGPGFGVESPVYVAIRWVQYVALLIVIGAIAFSQVVLAFATRVLDAHLVADARARATTLAIGATLLLGATALVRLLAQSYALHGERLAPDPALLATLLQVTQWGHAWLLEMGAIVVAVFAFIAARRGRTSGWSVAALAGGALTFSMALSGHAAATPTLRSLALIADSLHIIGGSGWLGSLLFVVAVGVPVALTGDNTQRWHRVAALVNAFSPTALVFASVTAVTGLFAAWLHVETIPALWQTRYGQMLLLKLAVLSVTAGIGLYNWQRVKPVLGAGPDGTRKLRRSAVAELTIGVAVLLITAILVATPTGMDM